MAVVATLALVAVVAASIVGPDRPEERIAQGYLAAFYGGEGSVAYERLAPSTRSVVFEGEFDRLAGLAAAIVGEDLQLRIVGSQRRSGTSLVGYRGSSAAGAVEGLVALAQVEGTWRVLEATYRFPDADRDDVAAFEAAVRSLNDQVRSRLDG